MLTGAPNIALLGKPGSGKTTAAGFLVDQLDYRRVPLARRFKEACISLWGPEVINDREKLQKMGEFVRTLDEDVFARNGLDDMNGFTWPEATRPYIPNPFVVDDARYPRDIELIVAGRQFVTVRVVSSRNLLLSRLQANGRLQNDDQLDAPTEVALDDYIADYTISNEEGLDHLYEQLMTIVGKELRKV